MKTIYRFSDIAYPKQKLPLVNTPNCLQNFIVNFLEGNLNDLTLVADNCTEDTVEKVNRLLQGYVNRCPMVRTNDGNAGAFRTSLALALQSFTDEEVVYFVESDYIHDVGSRKIFDEGFRLREVSADYVTLYAHPDKETYDLMQPCYVARSSNSYWRSSVATTMTFAARIKTLKEDLSVITKWTKGRHPQDNEMFQELCLTGRCLVNPLPGYSTHGETAWLSPMKDWSAILEKSIAPVKLPSVIKVLPPRTV